MSKHPHAELMMEYAKDAMETDKPWERWEWRSSDGEWRALSGGSSPPWFSGVEYRRKPRPIRIGKFDVPEPMRVAPELGSQYWVVELSAALLGKSYRWDGDGVDLRHLSQGICHTTREAAELHGRALLSLTAEGDKND